MSVAILTTQQQSPPSSLPLELTTTNTSSSVASAAGVLPNTLPSSSHQISGTSPPLSSANTAEEILSASEAAIEHQHYYGAAPKERLFDLNQLTEEEKIVLANSGSARLYQANNHEEINSIIQHAVETKTQDTILIVGPHGRQIVTRNENGDQIITRVVNTQPLQLQDSSVSDLYDEAAPDSHLHIPEPVLQFASPHDVHRPQTMYDDEPAVNDHLLANKSPPHTVIYEKHLTTAEQMQLLAAASEEDENEDGLVRKMKLVEMYSNGEGSSEREQEQQQQQQILFESNNDANNNGLESQIIKEVSSTTILHKSTDLVGSMINGDPQHASKIDLIYAPPGSNEEAVASAGATDGAQKTMELYASTNDLQNLISSGQVVVQQGGVGGGLNYSQNGNGTSTVFVVHGGLVDNGVDLNEHFHR